jgi:hypothetical protein
VDARVLHHEPLQLVLVHLRGGSSTAKQHKLQKMVPGKKKSVGEVCVAACR